MLIRQCAACLEFDNQYAGGKQVCEEIAKDRAILIDDAKRVLLGHRDPLLAEAIDQTVFIHFLWMAVPKVPVRRETGFADLITKKKEGIFHAASFCAFCAFLRLKNQSPYFSSLR